MLQCCIGSAITVWFVVVLGFLLLCFFVCDSYARFVGRDPTVWLIVPRRGAGYPPLRADPDGYATGKLRLCAYSVVHWRLGYNRPEVGIFSRRRQRSS